MDTYLAVFWYIIAIVTSLITMSSIIQSIKAMIAKHQQQVQQKKFLEAAMGACALLAVADGDIGFAELMARDYILDNVQQLQLFDANEAAEIFRLKGEALQNNYQEEKLVKRWIMRDCTSASFYFFLIFRYTLLLSIVIPNIKFKNKALLFGNLDDSLV